MQGTWVSFEVHYAVSKGYVIEEIFEQHHFPNQLNTLFAEYNKTLFDIKRKAKFEGNKGLKAIAKCVSMVLENGVLTQVNRKVHA